VFEVWPENVEAVELYLQAQWVIAAGMGAVIFVGLNYPALETLLRMRRVPRAGRDRLFAELQVMEGAARKVLNRKRDD